MIEIENENTLRAAFDNGLTLFIGSGFSALAKNSFDEAIPVGQKLIEKLIINFDLQSFEGLNLSQLCTIIESSRAAELRNFFVKLFSVNSFDPLYSQLDNIAIKYIFTTNVDDLAYKIFANTPRHYINDVTIKGPARYEKNAVNYVPLHGTVHNEWSKLAFTTTDIAYSFASDPDLWHYLTNQMQQLPSIFIGYSLSDAGILQALNPATTKGRELKDRWIVLRNPDHKTEEYFRALKFHIIKSDSKTFLEYIKNNPLSYEKHLPTEPTTKLFPDEAVPPLGTTPVRPLLDFYLGDTPTWSDIYSGRILKTKHFSTVENKIHGKNNVAVIGIPACGKTTLLMQCAADIHYHGHKLVLRSLTGEKAKHIIARLDGAQALIFIDDFSESTEAISLLLEHDNIVIVAFEREYNFEIVSHRLNRSRIDIIDVTELNPTDIQEVYNRLPPEIRRNRFISVATQRGVQLSIFEIVEANILRPTLKKRFAAVLEQLATVEYLRDLLIFIAYIHSCRTPVSFDMAYAFLRDKISSFQDVYSCVEKLGQLLSEYSGTLIDGEQDHYVPRSNIVSEAIIDQVSASIFRNVLERTHKDMTPLRICRYDIFKRRAFDASYFVKAFPNWSEGKEFYDYLYTRDGNPYLRQQGALYLSHKKRYQEAFSWIDEALLQTNGKVPSIKHTHAIVLFNANIEFAGQGNAIRSLLDQSMEILTECYNYDQRKSYHAVTFTDQALRYWNVFSDEKAIDYLRKSQKWLNEEHKRSPWHRRVKQLKNEVDKVLRTSKLS